MSAFGIDVASEAIRVFGEGVTKHQALDELVEAIMGLGMVDDVDAFRKAVHARESVMSTGIGSGVAIPHVRIDEVQSPSVGVAVSASGIEYDTLDNEPVHVIVLFAMPSGSQREYLGLLAQVMTALKTPGFRDTLAACTATDDVLAALENFQA
ncbi:MAG: PTS sugar transporter subunit IIA [bacterium]|nr:PTS sugar transporter subunit IIA [bacterium]